MPKPVTDITGHRFGRLTVLDIARKEQRPSGGSRIFWRCQCDCGRETIVVSDKLKNGHTSSCSCLWRDTLLKVHTKHGRAPQGNHHPTYTRWSNMRRRCEDPNHPRYPDWGGRGIKVCDRWQIFENFLADMGDCPPGMSLDRIDVNGDYEPSNCRYATFSEQSLNQRRYQK